MAFPTTTQRDVICYTQILLYALAHHDKVNGFAVTTSPCETFFGMVKQQCHSKISETTVADAVLHFTEKFFLTGDVYTGEEIENRKARYAAIMQYDTKGGAHQIDFLKEELNNFCSAVFDVNKDLVGGRYFERFKEREKDFPHLSEIFEQTEDIEASPNAAKTRSPANNPMAPDSPLIRELIKTQF